MDLQDLFFNLINMTRVVGQWAAYVYNLARVQEPHAVASGIYIRKQAHMVGRLC